MIDEENVELDGYVMIVCEKPSHEGKMKVRMSYEGDPMLVRYLLETGLQSFEENDFVEDV